MSHRKAETLRAKAEAAAKALKTLEQKPSADLSREEIARLLDELRVYQIELEMQNEELQASQLEVEASRDRYWHLFNHSPVGYLILNNDGMIVDANITFINIIGQERSAIVGKALSNFIHPEDKNVFLARYKSFFNNPKGKSLELRLRKFDESYLWVFVSGAQHLANEADAKQILVNVTDISGKKMLEEEQAKLQERMSNFQRLESLGILAGGMAHSFNNLLTIIRGSCELCLFNNAIDEEMKEFLQQGISASDRAAVLTSQMLAYAGKSNSQTCLINLGEEIESYLVVLQPSIPGEINLRLESQEEIFIECDFCQLQQAVFSLITNAAEAMAEKQGEISIKVYSCPIDEVSGEQFFCLPENPQKIYACIEICDQGHGIPMEIRHKIFDPFFSTRFQGRGLGLSATLGIMKKHNGAISLSADTEDTTCFSLYFPIHGQIANS